MVHCSLFIGDAATPSRKAEKGSKDAAISRGIAASFSLFRLFGGAFFSFSRDRRSRWNGLSYDDGNGSPTVFCSFISAYALVTRKTRFWPDGRSYIASIIIVSQIERSPRAPSL